MSEESRDTTSLARIDFLDIKFNVFRAVQFQVSMNRLWFHNLMFRDR